MWADQAADKRAISVVLMMLSPVVVDGKRSVPATGEGVNGKNCLVACMRPSHARRWPHCTRSGRNNISYIDVTNAYEFDQDVTVTNVSSNIAFMLIKIDASRFAAIDGDDICLSGCP
ncbi:hypothetical protein DFR42_10745 [Undibacterium pigrum]|uniref:Uncharacterized protein n=1 Tax=Undibacterium pigrum TaxID=401470 RepID=A0A318J1W9_9BURK|nr:hypothetical protein DFR42_10745 [Undibacterium pigrum]